MEINVIENTKKKLVFELRGVDHTFSNALKEELWLDKDIEAAGYNLDHPLIGVPRFVLKVNEGEPKDHLLNAVKRLKKTSEKFKAEFASSLK